MTYIDAQHLFKCKTCRNFTDGYGCTTFCDNGECYSPNMSKIPTVDVSPREEVAREIFAEIEVIIRKYDECPKYQLMIDLAKLKKEIHGGADMIERKRLIELLKDGGVRDFPYVSALADHLLANGVIVPPVKIGQTVYDYAHRECRVISVHFYDEGLPAFTVERTGYHGVKICQSYTFNKIGESVFITREESEKALAESDKHKKF